MWRLQIAGQLAKIGVEVPGELDDGRRVDRRAERWLRRRRQLGGEVVQVGVSTDKRVTVAVKPHGDVTSGRLRLMIAVVKRRC